MLETHHKNIKITILTPTYERAYILTKLYDSLIKQSDKRFIWVIVDDGSTDNTRKLVSEFEQKGFLIKYIYKKNGGKHTAINTGMQYIDTEYTFIVDSDDFLKPNAVGLINQWIDDIENVTGFAGVSGTRVHNDEKNTIIGEFPHNIEYVDCMNSERKKYKLSGDKAEVYKTDLLKQNPFPEYEDENFMPENVVWNKFSMMGLKLRWHKEGIVVCEYLDDGLTSSMRKIDHFEKNYKGYKDECKLSLQVMNFPYNYSAGSVFFAKCLAIGLGEGCLDEFDIPYYGKLLIKLFGTIRYQIGRY